MANSPLSTLKDKFGEKSKLVSAIEEMTKGDELWVSRLNSNKGLAHVSNAKLLRLHATFTAVKEKFGTRAKLIDAIAEVEKRKDDGFKTRLGAYPVPRLFDMWKSATKRAEPKPEKKKGAPKRVTAATAATAKKAAAPKKVAITEAQMKSAAAKKKKQQKKK